MHETHDTTVRATVRYVGAAFAGWQVQPAQRTVQGVIESALARIAGKPIRVHGAGRTDAGVHALAQVMSFHWDARTDLDKLGRSLSKMLAPDVLVSELAIAPRDFHARKSATGKVYAYTFSTARDPDPFTAPFAWTAPNGVDLERLRSLCAQFEGKLDFAAFQCAGVEKESTVRTLFSVQVAPGGVIAPSDAAGLYHITFHGDGFLYKMVRNITGTLIDVARGHLPESRINEMLASPGPYRGFTAPALGLALVRVEYGAHAPPQYSLQSVQRYEWVFGENFLSSSGADVARVGAAMLKLAPGLRVLDVGSGLGGAAFHFAEAHGAHVTGFDVLESMTVEARARADRRSCALVEFETGDVLAAPIAPNSFDAVYSKDSFLHIADKRALAARLFRILKPGGRLFFADYLRGPHTSCAEFEDYVSESGYHLATEMEYRALLEETGFEEVAHANLTTDLRALLLADIARIESQEAGGVIGGADREYLADRWRLKIRCCDANAMRWGWFSAHKPMAAS
ncbi:MAG: tRNA pseudouridine(38-40) synthase TruA [Candidatus Hydrogenedentes bacterium]|nr:tRNA pseudouridine(38-40) synthase TruA [Candidatus Hydrogenedentota bacterium]